MAVYGRTYRAYTGALTAEGWRFLVLARYALADLFASRAFLAFFVLCFVAPFVTSLRIYLAHNFEAIGVLDIPQSLVDQLLGVDRAFFRNWVLIPQSWFAFFLAMIVGPALISPDLRNNALPLYLARPIRRHEYVAGKLVVLFVLLSAVTWAPALLLFGMQSYLAPLDWISDNLRVAPALFVAAWAWILTLSLVGLAVSAVVRWKPVARLLFLALPFFLLAMGTVINVAFRTEWGGLIRVTEVLWVIWNGLLGLAVDPSSIGAPAAWAALAATWVFCLLILRRKVRAYEVER
jgi:ABC-type transport system involved in multi-copper enzyme maturation permease subunit